MLLTKLPVDVGVDRFETAVLGEDFAQQIAFPSGHFINNAAGAVAQLLRLVLSPVGPATKKLIEL